MKVRSGARIAGSSQSIDVELEDSDMRDIEGWDEKPLAERWRTMTKRADTLLVEYMLRGGHITQEYANDRLQQINK